MGQILARRQQSLTLHSQILSRLKRIESFSLENRNHLATRCMHLMLIYEEVTELQQLLVQRLHALQERSAPQQSSEPPKLSFALLTQKEEKILNLFAKGFSYQESAQYLGCKLSTIQSHTKNIYRKLNVHSRAEAVHEAQLMGFLNP